MEPGTKRRFGRVDLEVTAFGFGTAPVGNIFREIDEKTSDAMFQRAWDAGVRYFDTAPMYGHGLSELRTGQSLRWKSRDDLVLSSKVGRILKPARRDAIDFAPWSKNLVWFSHPIPGELWTDLKAKGLLREDAPVP